VSVTTDRARLHLGDCRAVLPTLPDASIDCVITDPPYPEISRPYGRLTEAEWWSLMMDVCRETRRVLKPTGSAVFILQPNSRKVGSMRGWLWRFMAWACDEWNMVQDAWWWNISALPTAGATDKGMMRASVKACVWLGPHDCYRDQDAVLWSESERNKADRAAGRFGRKDRHSGWRGDSKPRHDNLTTLTGAAVRRGGVTPFNLIPIGSGGNLGDGNNGHQARTPLSLCDYWTRYICPPDGTILDPFAGSGTMGLAALRRGRRFVGIESMPEYHAIAERRLAEELAKAPLLTACGA
jgi:DNA modification methylase